MGFLFVENFLQQNKGRYIAHFKYYTNYYLYYMIHTFKTSVKI
jgi:hypothetical protein